MSERVVFSAGEQGSVASDQAANAGIPITGSSGVAMSATPYYQDDLVTIYHGDCRDWMPKADVVVTDPPYGIGWELHGGGIRVASRKRPTKGDTDTSIRDDILSRTSAPAAVFGSFRSPPPVGVVQTLVYRKPLNMGIVGSVTGYRTDLEPVYLVGPWPKRTAVRSSLLETTWRHGSNLVPHPHMKPVDVLAGLMSMAPDGVVLDPFMGSGSTLVAAKSLGRKAIGIEIEERYCEIAANRCRQEVLGLEISA